MTLKKLLLVSTTAFALTIAHAQKNSSFQTTIGNTNYTITYNVYEPILFEPSKDSCLFGNVIKCAGTFSHPIKDDSNVMVALNFGNDSIQIIKGANDELNKIAMNIATEYRKDIQKNYPNCFLKRRMWLVETIIFKKK